MSLPDQPAPSTLRATSNASMAPLLDSELWEGILPDMPGDNPSLRPGPDFRAQRSNRATLYQAQSS